MKLSEAHNKLTRDFVMAVGKGCSSYSELMIVLESILLGSMQLNVKLFGQTPAVASGLVEVAVQQAIERFTAAHGKAP